MVEEGEDGLYAAVALVVVVGVGRVLTMMLSTWASTVWQCSQSRRDTYVRGSYSGTLAGQGRPTLTTCLIH